MASGHYKIHNGIEYLHIKCLHVFYTLFSSLSESDCSFETKWLTEWLQSWFGRNNCEYTDVFQYFSWTWPINIYQLIQFLSTLLNLPISGAGTSQLFYCAFERLVFKVKSNKTTVQPKGDCCRAGRQEVSRCCTRGELEESIVHRQWSMQASGSILVRNPGQTLLVFSNRVISGLRKMADVLRFFLKKRGGGERIPSMS